MIINAVTYGKTIKRKQEDNLECYKFIFFAFEFLSTHVTFPSIMSVDQIECILS